MKSVRILMVFLALSACTRVSEGDAWSLEESEIMSVSKILPPCGVFYNLLEMDLKDSKNKRKTIYLPCVEVIDGPLPEVGTICSAKGKMEFTHGLIANGSIVRAKPVRVARELMCDGKRYVFDL